MISSLLSHHNKNLKRQTSITALGQTVSQLSDRSVLQFHVTAQFYLESKGKYILKACGHANSKDGKRREKEEKPPVLRLLFLCFLLLLLGLPYVNWLARSAVYST